MDPQRLKERLARAYKFRSADSHEYMMVRVTDIKALANRLDLVETKLNKCLKQISRVKQRNS